MREEKDMSARHNILELSATIRALKNEDGSLKKDTLTALKRANPSINSILKVIATIVRF
jgi:hypothetical protein